MANFDVTGASGGGLKVSCGACGRTLLGPVHTGVIEDSPCPHCGSQEKHAEVAFEARGRVMAYGVARAVPEQGDRGLPEKGVIRIEGGTRVGRHGRTVHREATYDPYADVASELVVDTETGAVIVEKVESMKAKYLRRGRWDPAGPTHSPELTDQ